MWVCGYVVPINDHICCSEFFISVNFFPLFLGAVMYARMHLKQRKNKN